LDECAQWDLGQQGDQSGDTVFCRLHELIEQEHCSHAGPDTEKNCVPDDSPPECKDYCDIVQVNCVGQDSQHQNKDACETFCDHWWPGNVGDQSGKSVGCLYWHAEQAANAPQQFCDNAGPSSAACVFPC
jgi:hypothetical protein